MDYIHNTPDVSTKYVVKTKGYSCKVIIKDILDYFHFFGYCDGNNFYYYDNYERNNINTLKFSLLTTVGRFILLKMR